MKFYEMAMEKAKDYTFFTKWNAVIPIMEKTNHIYTIFLILTESYFSNSAYPLKIVFNRSSNEIEMISNEFNLLKK